MITLDRHPAVERIVDEWKASLRAQSPHGQRVYCTEDDLKRLIASLETALATTSDHRSASPFGLRLNWKRIRGILQHLTLRGHKA